MLVQGEMKDIVKFTQVALINLQWSGEKSLPRVAIANDLDIDGIAGLILKQSLDELLVHPVIKLAHPVTD